MTVSLNLKQYRDLIAGIDSPTSLTEVLARMTADAEDGDPDANYLLALLYGRGEIYPDQGPLVEPNQEKCRYYMMRALQRGSPYAAFQFSHCPNQDWLMQEERQELLRRATQALLPEAVYETALHHLFFDGDPVLAASLCDTMYYTKAKGSAAAAGCYLAAILTPNRVRSELLARRATDLGHRGARRYYASLLRQYDDEEKNRFADFLERWYANTQPDVPDMKHWPFLLGIRDRDEPEGLIAAAMVIDEKRCGNV